MKPHFGTRGWRMFNPDRVPEHLLATSKAGYENDVAFVVSKLPPRGKHETDDDAIE